MNGKKALCIFASNFIGGRKGEAAGRICKLAAGAFREKKISAEILDLQETALTPCTGCGRCFERQCCVEDENFDQVYTRITEADYLFVVAPYHAPVPAKLCIILEKILQLAISCRQPEACRQPGLFRQPELSIQPEPSMQPGLCGKLAGIISCGEGGEKMLMHYKAMVNDIIADALRASHLKVVPFNSRWNTGISFSVTEDFQKKKIRPENSPVRECEWGQIEEKVGMYVEIMVQTSRTLYAIL